jgi:hypothetical protein
MVVSGNWFVIHVNMLKTIYEVYHRS